MSTPTRRALADYSTSAVLIGKWLIEAALRDPRSKLPSHEAHKDGYCIQVPGGPSGQYTYHWHTQKTVARLLGAVNNCRLNCLMI